MICVDEYVVGDNGGNGGEEAGSRRNQCFRDAGRHGAQGGRAGRANPWKASMMPHTVPNRPMKGVTAPVVASQGKRLSSRVSSSDAAICVAR